MRVCKAISAISLLLLVAACSHAHPAGVAYEPNPSPPPGYRVVCTSTPLLLNAYITNCIPAAGEQVAVVRAKS
jgi:hypothetical protein